MGEKKSNDTVLSTVACHRKVQMGRIGSKRDWIT